jgi:hypothetical protein
MILAPYLDLCIRAHNWTSHWPEKRGKYYVETYSAILEEDLALLPEENREDYKNRFINLFTTWMHRKSNCISSFITGGSNFPVRRAERANRSEEKAYTIFEDFRKRYFRRLNRKARPGLDGELEEAMINLKKREEDQVRMKEINKVIKNKKKNPFDGLVELGFTPAQAEKLLTPDFMGRVGFAGYSLTNNNANIKRLRERVDYLTKKVELRERNEDEPQNFPGGQYIVNRVEDRLQFIFDAKPEHEVICRFKKEGWNWSPRFKAWQRKITPNAFASAKQIYLTLNSLTK